MRQDGWKNDKLVVVCWMVPMTHITTPKRRLVDII